MHLQMWSEEVPADSPLTLSMNSVAVLVSVQCMQSNVL